jgi:hypothetical protein
MMAGADDSGGVGNASLSDGQASFMKKGVLPHKGMILYNTTQNTSGPVTAVTQTTITAVGVTWDDADGYRIVLLTGIERSTIEHYLNVSASDIHAALAASGACDCTLASWAPAYLAKLNIIDAAAYYQCPCGQPSFDPGQQAGLLEWASNELANLRMMKVDVCAGATGSDFPVTGWAQQGTTEFARIKIIADDILKSGG